MAMHNHLVRQMRLTYPETVSSPTIMNDHEGAGDKEPLLFRVIGKLVPGPDYHEASARDARRRIVAFFDAHLKEDAAQGADG